jgi:hypothetical protein
MALGDATTDGKNNVTRSQTCSFKTNGKAEDANKNIQNRME